MGTRTYQDPEVHTRVHHDHEERRYLESVTLAIVQEPEVRTRAHEDQDRYLETREPSVLIKTATPEIVDKSLLLAPAATVSPE